MVMQADGYDYGEDIVMEGEGGMTQHIRDTGRPLVYVDNIPLPKRKKHIREVDGCVRQCVENRRIDAYNECLRDLRRLLKVDRKCKKAP